MLQGSYPIESIRQIAADTFDMVLACAPLAKTALPGQFVHLRCADKPLRRPISICEILPDALRLVFAVRGEGTAWLSQCKAGESIDVMGPLGNGFPLQEGKAALFVGGGIGTPPLLEAAKQYTGKADAVLGFRNKAAAILLPDFERHCETVLVTTDDGSLGTQGLVTDDMRLAYQVTKYDVVYACGPAAMLKAVQALAEQLGSKCYVSLEERMGCGVGACLVCACKTQKAGDEKAAYRHVCKDGPVFLAKEVVWE